MVTKKVRFYILSALLWILLAVLVSRIDQVESTFGIYTKNFCRMLDGILVLLGSLGLAYWFIQPEKKEEEQ